MWSPGHRAFALVSFSREYFKLRRDDDFGVLGDAAVDELRLDPRSAIRLRSDMNGDGSTNDLIYIPRDTSEMNFAPFTVGTRTFTPAEQAAAYEAYIQQDPYLSEHRGEYAQRNALSFPMLRRLDLSIAQDIFRNLGGQPATASRSGPTSSTSATC